MRKFQYLSKKVGKISEKIRGIPAGWNNMEILIVYASEDSLRFNKFVRFVHSNIICIQPKYKYIPGR